MKRKNTDTASASIQIDHLLDTFHAAAARADFPVYFGCFADQAVFIGTDASEHWNKTAFMQWAKPYFDRKSTWSFTSVSRHIYFNEEGNTAWFDELLDTQMKICRGSGVLRRYDTGWKIEQYVLSMTIPNDLSNRVTALKSGIEDSLLQTLTIVK